MTEVLVLGLVSAAGAVGVYLVSPGGSPWCWPPSSAPSACCSSRWWPILHHRRELAELDRSVPTATRWLFTIGFPLCLVEILFGHDLLTLFGEGFVSGTSALTILALGQLVNVGTARPRRARDRRPHPPQHAGLPAVRRPVPGAGPPADPALGHRRGRRGQRVRPRRGQRVPGRAGPPRPGDRPPRLPHPGRWPPGWPRGAVAWLLPVAADPVPRLTVHVATSGRGLRRAAAGLRDRPGGLPGGCRVLTSIASWASRARSSRRSPMWGTCVERDPLTGDHLGQRAPAPAGSGSACGRLSEGRVVVAAAVAAVRAAGPARPPAATPQARRPRPPPPGRPPPGRPLRGRAGHRHDRAGRRGAAIGTEFGPAAHHPADVPATAQYLRDVPVEGATYDLRGVAYRLPGDPVPAGVRQGPPRGSRSTRSARFRGRRRGGRPAVPEPGPGSRSRDRHDGDGPAILVGRLVRGRRPSASTTSRTASRRSAMGRPQPLLHLHPRRLHRERRRGRRHRLRQPTRRPQHGPNTRPSKGFSPSSPGRPSPWTACSCASSLHALEERHETPDGLGNGQLFKWSRWSNRSMCGTQCSWWSGCR